MFTTIKMEIKYRKIEKLTSSGNRGKWWEDIINKDYLNDDQDDDDEKKSDKIDKWTTLVHNGILFPPPYQPLPKGITILYDGKPYPLNSEDIDNPFNVTEEEACVFMAMKLEQQSRLKKQISKKENDIFFSNFWNDWKQILKKNTKIKDINKVDFTIIKDFLVKRAEEKKEERSKLTKEEKEEIKEQKQAVKDIYGYALIDDAKISIGGGVQPPGLFVGHGGPNVGKIKKRILPEDITLNVSKNSVPICETNGKKCKWGEIVEDRKSEWIAKWKNPITGKSSYVQLNRNESPFVCKSDLIKFNKARALNNNIESVREKYTLDMNSKEESKRQHGTAVYMLDHLAIRPGTEKDEKKEAETVGLTTLSVQNIKFIDDKKYEIKLNFLGKSSIEYNKQQIFTKQAYINLKHFCENKNKNEKLFSLVTDGSLNTYLKTLLKCLTSKVFRTWKASSTLQSELGKKKIVSDFKTNINSYKNVNIQVGIALNHKNLSNNNDSAIEKINNDIQELEEKIENEKNEKKILAMEQKIQDLEVKLQEKQENVSLGTSKANYLDPRITVSWCKEAEVPIEKIYNKSNLQKFIWAMETPENFKF
jgi:DNA topoisomerase-1